MSDEIYSECGGRRQKERVLRATFLYEFLLCDEKSIKLGGVNDKSLTGSRSAGPAQQSSLLT